jgi:hypothetical protein
VVRRRFAWTGFGTASERERRDADLFWAALTGSARNAPEHGHRRRAGVAAPFEADTEDLPARYGGYTLQRGDDDAQQIWGGRRRGPGQTQPAAGQTGFVRKLQEDLRALGFTVVGPPNGTFGWQTEWAMREFQHVADSRWLAQEQAPTAAAPPPRYVDRLTQVQTPASLLTPSNVTGWLSANDAARIDLWLANRWRCPVVIEAWDSADLDANGQPIAGRRPQEQNIWRHDEPAQQSWRVLARDFSKRYDVAALGRNVSDLRVLGFRQTRGHGGPESLPPLHVWREAEITAESMTGRAIGGLTPDELSTFKVVRAFSETECEGFLDSLNCWDSVILSAGPGHWPIGEPRWSPAKGWDEGGELGGFLAFLRRFYPAAYQRLTDLAIQPERAWDPADVRFFNRSQRRYASRLQWRRPAHDSAFETVPLDPEEMKYFKSWRWVYRFEMAARTDPEYRRAMWDHARIRVRDVLATPWGGALQVGSGAAARPATFGDVFRSELNVAMVVRWHIRFPGNVVTGGHAGPDMIAMLASAGIASADPATWGNAEETRLTNAIMASPTLPDTMDTVRNWPTWSAASNPKRFALDLSPLPAAERTLRANRGSFRLSVP